MQGFVTALALILLGGATAARAQNTMPDTPTPLNAAPLPSRDPDQANATSNLLDDVVARKPLALGQFLAWAERGNPTIAEANAAVDRDAKLGRQAALYPNPSIGYSGEHIRGGSYGGGEQGAYAQQEIVLGGKLGLRRKVYDQQANADRSAVDAQRYRVRAGVERAFYQALAAQQTVVLRQKLLKNAMDAEATAHQLANVGQADAPDVLQAEVDTEQARVDFTDAQHDFRAGFQDLAALAGQSSLPVSPLAGSLEPPPALDAEAVAQHIVEASPEVERAQQEVAAAEARVKDESREAVPDLTLRAGGWWSGEQLIGINEPAGPMGFASAEIGLPLWNRNQGNAGAAKAELEYARQEVLRTELNLRRDAKSLAQQYLAASFEAERYRTVLIPDAERANALYVTKYEQMASAYPQVLFSQRTLLQLQIAYLHALDAVWSSAVTLQNFGAADGLGKPEDGSDAVPSQ